MGQRGRNVTHIDDPERAASGHAGTHEKEGCTEFGKIRKAAVRAPRFDFGEDWALECRARFPSRFQAYKKLGGGISAALMQLIGFQDAVNAVRGVMCKLREQFAHLSESCRIIWIFENDRGGTAGLPRHGLPIRDLSLFIHDEQSG